MKTTETLESKDWDSDGCRTPKPFWEELSSKYRFVCDLFSSDENKLLPMNFTKERSAFAAPWPRLNADLARRHAPVIGVLDPESDAYVTATQVLAFSDDTLFGWNYGNPRYSAGGCPEAIEGSIQNARLGSGIVLLMPSSTGAGWFQKLLLRPCNVLDAYQVNGTEWLNGYELSMQGIGYRQKLKFLSRRPPFDKPIGYPEARKWSGPAGDSILVELRPPL